MTKTRSKISRLGHVGVFLTAFSVTLSQPLAAGQGLPSAYSDDGLGQVRSQIGSKCVLTILDGRRAEGVLWGFDGKHIILKVRRSSLYAKAEKYGVGEILVLETEDGNRIDFAALLTNRENGQPAPFPLIAGSDSTSAPGTVVEDIADNLPETLKSGAGTDSSGGAMQEGADRIDEDGFEQDSPRGAERPRSIIPAPVKPTIKKPEMRKRVLPKKRHRKVLYARQDSTQLSQPLPDASGEEKLADAGKELSLPPFQREQVVTAVPAADRIGVLESQAAILFVVVSLLGVLLVAAKLRGLGTPGQTESRLLIPARIVRISGSYSIIDQGESDGLQTGETIHFFHKHASDVAYCAKGQVVRCKHSHAAVQITERSIKWPLVVGDAAFRHRSIMPASGRSLRRLWAAGLARMSAFRKPNQNHGPAKQGAAADGLKVTVISAEEEDQLMRSGIAKL